MIAQCSPVSTTQKPTSAQQLKRIQDQSNKEEKVRLNSLLTLCTKNIQCYDKPLDEYKWQKTEHWPPQNQCKFRDNFKHKIILTFSNKYLKVLAETEEAQDSIPFLCLTLCAGWEDDTVLVHANTPLNFFQERWSLALMSVRGSQSLQLANTLTAQALVDQKGPQVGHLNLSLQDTNKIQISLFTQY